MLVYAIFMTDKDDKQARLAEALRANLRKRKAQARAQPAPAPEPGAPSEPDAPSGE
ncbi:hypothetical protein FHR23_002249 [Stakelama sediminis]|uniref:Uncharacterized protein n=1 Tax=Stakelama sediminis TaxID=463200 RepID=A0A840Z028_9SPHN|nr:hypothetical protein [Stakelama sediminis]